MRNASVSHAKWSKNLTKRRRFAPAHIASWSGILCRAAPYHAAGHAGTGSLRRTGWQNLTQQTSGLTRIDLCVGLKVFNGHNDSPFPLHVLCRLLENCWLLFTMLSCLSCSQRLNAICTVLYRPLTKIIRNGTIRDVPHRKSGHLGIEMFQWIVP